MGGLLQLRSVAWMLKEGLRFVVPSYQRGYRWQERQVRELLDDLAEFEQSSRKSEGFYCLQPIVVTPSKHEHGAWDVIDGQQRLTTLHLVLTFLKAPLHAEGLECFSLRYATRERSAEFLLSPTEDLEDESIDFAHIWAAWTAVNRWFDNYDGLRGDFLRLLIRPDGRGPNVRVIWYELPETEKPIEVFRRLNVGKIPLTSAELIRALFLGRDPRDTEREKSLRLRIAYQWDEIERHLQDDVFWYFVHEGTSPYATRIEYLFAILMLQKERTIELGDHGLFLTYLEWFKSRASDLDRLWQEVRDLHLALSEWYEDENLGMFHLVGTAVTLKTWGTTPSASSETVIVDLLQKRENLRHSEIDAYLRRSILDQLFPRLVSEGEPLHRDELAPRLTQRLEQLNYPDDPRRRPIRGVLLLFNVATLMRHGARQRFRFDLFKRQGAGWDIEHIRSVRSEMPGVVQAQRGWLVNVLDYWSGQSEPPGSLRARAEALLGEATHDKAAFASLYLEILEEFGEAEEEEVDNGLGNLTLLDATTNRRYGNAVFPIKRREVTGLDKTGGFTPPCTTNAFLKYYSKHPSDMFFWKSADRDDYRNAITSELLEFFCPGDDP